MFKFKSIASYTAISVSLIIANPVASFSINQNETAINNLKEDRSESSVQLNLSLTPSSTPPSYSFCTKAAACLYAGTKGLGAGLFATGGVFWMGCRQLFGYPSLTDSSSGVEHSNTMVVKPGDIPQQPTALLIFGAPLLGIFSTMVSTPIFYTQYLDNSQQESSSKTDYCNYFSNALTPFQRARK